MAKRRNLKKEKVQRNQAYARKFRKRKGTGRLFGNRQYNNRPPRDKEQEEGAEKQSSDSFA